MRKQAVIIPGMVVLSSTLVLAATCAQVQAQHAATNQQALIAIAGFVVAVFAVISFFVKPKAGG